MQYDYKEKRKWYQAKTVPNVTPELVLCAVFLLFLGLVGQFYDAEGGIINEGFVVGGIFMVLPSIITQVLVIHWGGVSGLNGIIVAPAFWIFFTSWAWFPLILYVGGFWEIPGDRFVGVGIFMGLLVFIAQAFVIHWGWVRRGGSELEGIIMALVLWIFVMPWAWFPLILYVGGFWEIPGIYVVNWSNTLLGQLTIWGGLFCLFALQYHDHLVGGTKLTRVRVRWLMAILWQMAFMVASVIALSNFYFT